METMLEAPKRISLDEWDARYAELIVAGLNEPSYGGPLRRHVTDGDYRLLKLQFDNSAAALRLWNFLLTEEDRLHKARAAGQKIIGTMKDLGTVPVMAFASPRLTAFYPDGAWWLPCVMEMSTSDLAIADQLGIDESFCPVRAMLGAFVNGEHFPVPDLLVCSAGAVCDDFSAIAQRLEGLGHSILWWEVPHRRVPDADEERVKLPGGFIAPRSQVRWVKSELERVLYALQGIAGEPITEELLSHGIRSANRARTALRELRQLAYSAPVCPLPALEMLIAEMLIIHFCSDREETILVLEELLAEVRERVKNGVGVLPLNNARIFWVNPVADLRIMNALENFGGRVCGTEYLFCHALDPIPENLDPLEALAQMALADPMVGPAAQRAERICRDAQAFGAEAVLISRIPGASHCATEGGVMRDIIEVRLGLPVLELETPPLCDALLPSMRTRMEALIETVKERRGNENKV
jgi:benzoyl-CoA reductase/2-hydroxyglutaryl-CoA dehydratase subunit BcrC/BadD/HgdB